MKKEVSFSLQLLKMNRKHHADSIKRMERGNSTNITDKQMLKFFNKNLNNHKKYYADLSLAISILLRKETIHIVGSSNFVQVNKKQATGRIVSRQKPEYKIIKNLK